MRDSALVYDVIRGNVDGRPLHRRRDEPFVEAAERAPGRLRIGWSTKPVSLGVTPDPVHVRAVEDTARLLAELGHDVRRVDPRYPDPTAAFVPQFFAGIRAEAGLVEHYDRLERRTRQTCRLGSWVTPQVVEWALGQTEKVSTQGQPGLRRRRRAAHPGHRAPPPPVGRLDGAGTVRASLRSMPSIAYAALWNVAGNPAASVPCGIAADGLPVAVQLVGRTDDEATLFSLAAQLEEARPWPLVAATSSIVTAALTPTTTIRPRSTVGLRRRPIRAPTYPPTIEPAASSTTASQSSSATAMKMTLATRLLARIASVLRALTIRNSRLEPKPRTAIIITPEPAPK